MTTKSAYILVGLVLVLGAGWAYSQGTFSSSVETLESAVDQKQNEIPENATEATQKNSAGEHFNGSFSQLLARSGSWQCDVSISQNGITSSGTTYISGGMMRGDFSSTIPQVGKVETHMIMRDNTAYTWTSMMNQGFKFPMQNGQVNTSANAQAAATFNQNYDYDCKAWVSDESKFALPSGITF